MDARFVEYPVIPRSRPGWRQVNRQSGEKYRQVLFAVQASSAISRFMQLFHMLNTWLTISGMPLLPLTAVSSCLFFAVTASLPDPALKLIFLQIASVLAGDVDEMAEMTLSENPLLALSAETRRLRTPARRWRHFLLRVKILTVFP